MRDWLSSDLPAPTEPRLLRGMSEADDQHPHNILLDTGWLKMTHGES